LIALLWGDFRKPDWLFNLESVIETVKKVLLHFTGIMLKPNYIKSFRITLKQEN